MKTKAIFSSLFLFMAILAFAQDRSQGGYPRLGDAAPSFTAESTAGTINFPDDYGSKWKILFSHPADFTPVCSSEILELAEAGKDFDNLGVQIVVLSVDQVTNHREWVKSMETLKYKDREPVKITFPLVADPGLSVSRQYGMIHSGASSTKDVRGVFIIDPENKIRAMMYYPMNIGRNIAEIERTVAALQTADKQQVLTPANWRPGDDVLVPYSKSQGDAGASAKTSGDAYEVTWYMKFKKSGK